MNEIRGRSQHNHLNEIEFLNTTTSVVDRKTWTLSAACRPTVLYVAAYAASLTPHEAAHALTAYYLGFGSTLYQMWVNPDAAEARPAQVAIISASGPVFSLAFGLAAWLIYRKFRSRRWSFVVLMLAISNLYIVFGNMTGAGFGGDINRALTVLGVAVPFFYATSFIGIGFLGGFMFAMGKELFSWAPVSMERRTAVVAETLAPWLIGTVIALIAYVPLPTSLIWPNLVGSVFWGFAVLGAWFGRKPRRNQEANGNITIPDLVVTALALILVRLLVPGLRLAP